MQKIEYSISTLEVAEMLETEHWQLLRKLDGQTKDGKHVKGYIEILGDNEIVVTDYFLKSTYKTGQNKEMPCYQVTRLGCDFLANKFTGEKGVLFTARYVKRFHEMEEQLLKENHMDWFVNNIRVFQHREFGVLRTLKLDGQDYFIGQDATRSLGYVNNGDTLKKRVSNPEKCYVSICDGTRSRKMVAITKKGLNELIQTGKLPLASKYNEWIQKQVIPVLAGKEEMVPVTIKTGPLKDELLEKTQPKPMTKLVVDIPENVKAQHILMELKKSAIVLEVLADESNRYRSQEDFEKYQSVVSEILLRIIGKISDFRELKPKLVEKYL